MRTQRERITSAFEDIAVFISALKSTSNQHGTLWEQTTLAIGSEIGRFPKLNGQRGKDHWPENSWMLLGRGIARGRTIGATDLELRGQAIDFDSGAMEGANRRPIFLDSIFATLLKVAGAEPMRHGYERDAVLSCCLA